MTDENVDLSEVKTLHARLVDSRNGYEEGLKLTTDSAVVTVFKDLLELRDDHIAELDRLLREKGETPDEDGSWMTPIHEAIMNVRSWFGGLDESVFQGVISGEEDILEMYEKAISAVSPIENFVTALTEQKAVLSSKVQDLRSLQAAS